MIPKDLFNGLPFGICPFEKLQDRLLNVRKKSEIPPHAATVIVALFPYYLGEEAYRDLNISRYAVPCDYHLIAGEILRKAANRLSLLYTQNTFVPFCDNSPIPEVFAAATAGLGCIGKNGLLIHETYGSFCFIGEIVTDLPVFCKPQGIQRCIGCGICENACPTGAVHAGVIQKERCLSEISQKKKPLTREETDLIRKSGCAWGCDICQTVCPMNRSIQKTPIDAFAAAAVSHAEKGMPIQDRAFAWRGEKIINRNLEILENIDPNQIDRKGEKS